MAEVGIGYVRTYPWGWPGGYPTVRNHPGDLSTEKRWPITRQDPGKTILSAKANKNPCETGRRSTGF